MCIHIVKELDRHMFNVSCGLTEDVMFGFEKCVFCTKGYGSKEYKSFYTL